MDCGTTVDLIEDLVHDTRRRQRRRLSSEAVRRRKLDPNEKLSIPFKRRAPRKPGACNITAQNPSALSVLFLALLSTTSAAPPPTRPLNHLPSPFRSSPTTPPVPRRYEVDDKVHIVTTAPSDIPTAVLIVDETALPYVLTQVQDGSWSKIDDAWFLYGRQAGVNSPPLDGGASDVHDSLLSMSSPTELTERIGSSRRTPDHHPLPHRLGLSKQLSRRGEHTRRLIRWC